MFLPNLLPSSPAGADLRSRESLDVRALNERLLGATSATAVLNDWAALRGFPGGPIRAERQFAASLGDDLLEALGASRFERVRHRRVRLFRGDLALVEADNRFLPDRLPPGLERELDVTTTPFGALIAPLSPSRRTFHVAFPEEIRLACGAGPSPDPQRAIVLEHKAVVLDRGGRALAAVHERYLGTLVA